MKPVPGFIGWIPARGGSKGVPRKALAPLGGLPLIAWTIRDALAATALDRVIVSTDDAEIAAVAREHGAEVPGLRPARLAGDHANLTEALEHTLAGLRETGYTPRAVCVMSPTNPFRRPDRLPAALERLAGEPELHCLRAMAPVEVHPADCVTLDAEGFVRPLLHRGAPIRRAQRVGAESLSFNLFRVGRPGRIEEAVLLDAVEGTDIDEPRDLLRARAIIAAEGNHAPADGPRFPLLSRSTIEAARRLHRAHGDPVISLRAVRHHPWRAFDLDLPRAPRHLLDGELPRGRRQDLPPVYEPVEAIVLPERAAAGAFRGIVLPEEESLRLDGPIEREMLRLLAAQPLGGARDPLGQPDPRLPAGLALQQRGVEHVDRHVERTAGQVRGR